MLNLYRQNLKWIIFFDFVFTFFSWQIVSLCRLYFLYNNTHLNGLVTLGNLYWFESIILPFVWIVLFYFSGDYSNLFIKNKFSEFTSLVKSTLMGCLVVFFVVIINDINDPYIDFTYYYLTLSSFYIIQLLCVFSGRVFFINFLKKKVKNNKEIFPILVVSDKKKPLDFITKKDSPQYEGYKIIGAVSKVQDFDSTNYLGTFDQIVTIIKNQNVEIVIINLENKEHKFLTHCFNLLSPLRIEIKFVPDIIDIVAGNFKSNNILGLDLIDLHLELLPEWEFKMKRIVDILFSIVAIVILSPLFLYIIIRVKMSSQGNVFYKQERIGYKQMPFYIYKFRSMVMNAEKINTPQLAQNNDSRITAFGKKMRKWRLDELPQFWNVLKGDMSIIGPRPERKFFIQQLEENGIPFSNLILRIKPGISSMGMVRYGYASNLEEMKDRLKFDLIYIENISVLLDMRMIFATIKIVLKGVGK